MQRVALVHPAVGKEQVAGQAHRVGPRFRRVRPRLPAEIREPQAKRDQRPRGGARRLLVQHLDPRSQTVRGRRPLHVEGDLEGRRARLGEPAHVLVQHVELHAVAAGFPRQRKGRRHLDRFAGRDGSRQELAKEPLLDPMPRVVHQVAGEQDVATDRVFLVQP